MNQENSDEKESSTILGEAKTQTETTETKETRTPRMVNETTTNHDARKEEKSGIVRVMEVVNPLGLPEQLHIDKMELGTEAHNYLAQLYSAESEPQFNFEAWDEPIERYGSKVAGLSYKEQAEYMNNAEQLEADRERLAVLTEFDSFKEKLDLEENIEILEAAVEQKSMIDSTPSISLATSTSFSSLIDENMTFDPSQTQAIDGMIKQKYACLTGAAGTGKTTITKALIHALQHKVSSVNTSKYFKSKVTGPIRENQAFDRLDTTEDAPESVTPDHFVPSIALCAFTGRATQMIKKNFPDSWHPNIMTIHRLLHFVPVSYEELGPDGIMVTKRRFDPNYNKMNKLPWDIIVIDECGMLSLALATQLFDACHSGTRIFFIGDINQLPPVHGDSIFGYAMAQYPSFELTHIHRQKGVDNPIVDNAWRILKGERPEPHPDFTMLVLDSNPMKAGQMLQNAVIFLNKEGKFSPESDTAIVAVNGTDMEQRGYWLGQIPNNQALARILNPIPMDKRILIDAGRSKKEFAVGDKVMVTKNDHEKQITNGMTGFIISINRNGHYQGDISVTGPVDEVNAYISNNKEDHKEMVANIESLLEMDELPSPQEFYRGKSSHVVTVSFTPLGMNEGIIVSFDSYSEVDSLQHAYVVTCHKSQGGEYPLVIIAVHDCYSGMMTREWLYTAVTRASKQVLLLFTERALSKALRTQSITGSSLKEKVQRFISLGKSKYSKAPVLRPAQEIHNE